MSISTKPQLSEIATAAVQAVKATYALELNKIAVSLIDLTSPKQLQYGSFQGDQPIYPASIVKLFFLTAACMSLEKHAVEPTSKLLSAITEMIVNSSNPATSYVVDVLTGTDSGEELSKEEMADWSLRRQKLNKLFLQQEYKDINICQKTWNDSPYGRDKLFLGEGSQNRNSLTTNSTAKLLADIVLRKMANPEYTNFMMKLLERDYLRASDDPDDQATAFSAAALPQGAKLWSKAGWTSEVRHDAAYIEFPGGRRLVMVIFTQGYSDNPKLIPELAFQVLSRVLSKACQPIQ